MAKLKLRIDKDSSLDEIEQAICAVLNCGQQEIELSQVIKIVEALGGEYLTGKKGGKGSQARFRHPGLAIYPSHYQDGQFGVHFIHGGKENKKVLIKDFKNYLDSTLKIICEIKRKRN